MPQNHVAAIYSKKSQTQVFLPPGTIYTISKDSGESYETDYPHTVWRIPSNQMLYVRARPDLPAAGTVMQIADGFSAKFIPGSGNPASVPGLGTAITLAPGTYITTHKGHRFDLTRYKGMAALRAYEYNEDTAVIKLPNHVVISADGTVTDSHLDSPSGERYQIVNEAFTILSMRQEFTYKTSVDFPCGKVPITLNIRADLSRGSLAQIGKKISARDKNPGEFKSSKQKRKDTVRDEYPETPMSEHPLLHLFQPQRGGAASYDSSAIQKQKRVYDAAIHYSTSEEKDWGQALILRSTQVSGVTDIYSGQSDERIDIGSGQPAFIQDIIEEKIEEIIIRFLALKVQQWRDEVFHIETEAKLNQFMLEKRGEIRLEIETQLAAYKTNSFFEEFDFDFVFDYKNIQYSTDFRAVLNSFAEQHREASRQVLAEKTAELERRQADVESKISESDLSHRESLSEKKESLMQRAEAVSKKEISLAEREQAMALAQLTASQEGEHKLRTAKDAHRQAGLESGSQVSKLEARHRNEIAQIEQLTAPQKFILEQQRLHASSINVKDVVHGVTSCLFGGRKPEPRAPLLTTAHDAAGAPGNSGISR